MRVSTPLFIDKIEIKVASGNGGAGCVSFQTRGQSSKGRP